MSAQEKELRNIYRFFGLDDFETDQSRWQAAFDNVEKVYGFKFNGDYTDQVNYEPPEHLKKVYPHLDIQQWREFFTNLKQIAESYRLTFVDPNKLADYNRYLEAHPELQQKPSENINYKGALGRNFAPDASDKNNTDFYKHLMDAKEYRVKDGLDPQALQDLLNKFMVDYHIFTTDKMLSSREARKEAEMKDITPVGGSVANVKPSGNVYDVKPEDVETPEKPTKQDDAPKQKRAEQPAEDAHDEPEAEPKSPFHSAFADPSRNNMIYPPRGVEDQDKLKQTMLFANKAVDWKNINLQVLTAIEGQRYLWNRKSGFSIEGRLDVVGQDVVHGNRPPEHVAVFGKIDIKCNGGFLNGDVDGRMRSTKYKQAVVPDAEGKPKQVDVPVHSYSKGKVVIDAGDEDLVINGDLLGKVEIRTTGRVKIIGHINGNVTINAGKGIDVLGDVKGGVSLSTDEGSIDINGKKSMRVSTKGTTNVRAAAITPAMIHEARYAAAHANFAGGQDEPKAAPEAEAAQASAKAQQSAAHKL